jgi:hypothetical protein
MKVCIVKTACPTHLTLTSQRLDAIEKPWFRLTRKAIQINATVVCIGVCKVALGRNLAEGIGSEQLESNRMSKHFLSHLNKQN